MIARLKGGRIHTRNELNDNPPAPVFDEGMQLLLKVGLYAALNSRLVGGGAVCSSLFQAPNSRLVGGGAVCSSQLQASWRWGCMQLPTPG